MSVSAPTASNPAGSVANYATTTVRKPKQSLGSEDFMKLLAVQFQSQDPMKPMEDSAFIAQMAQFSALEQSNSLVKEMGLLRSDQQNVAASGMLGRTVTVTDEEGKPVIGEVSAIESTDNGPALIIDGNKYSLSAVRRVEITQPELPPAA